MSNVAVMQKLDAGNLVNALHETLAKLDSGTGELVLDLAAVGRVNTAAIRALEALAARAEEKAVKPVLRGVNVEVYKVLKLAGLANHFTFAN